MLFLKYLEFFNYIFDSDNFGKVCLEKVIISRPNFAKVYLPLHPKNNRSQFRLDPHLFTIDLSPFTTAPHCCIISVSFNFQLLSKKPAN